MELTKRSAPSQGCSLVQLTGTLASQKPSRSCTALDSTVLPSLRCPLWNSPFLPLPQLPEVLLPDPMHSGFWGQCVPFIPRYTGRHPQRCEANVTKKARTTWYVACPVLRSLLFCLFNLGYQGWQGHIRVTEAASQSDSHCKHGECCQSAGSGAPSDQPLAIY